MEIGRRRLRVEISKQLRDGSIPPKQEGEWQKYMRWLQERELKTPFLEGGTLSKPRLRWPKKGPLRVYYQQNQNVPFMQNSGAAV